ncbi:branched-chain amino acid transaminase [bacterium]|nr:branched-chain amino acid transaminase [bacterium]
MEPTKYIWMDGEFVLWEEAKVHALTHALHYGSGAFEGLRAYETPEGPALFRVQEHFERLFYSTKAIGMEIPFSVEELEEATLELVRRNELEHCYIRPLAFYGYGKMGLNPTDAPVQVMIACWPWGAYLPHEMVDLKVSSYIRIHPKSTVADAKICGHYVNSILAVRELIGTDFHEALFLDYEGNIAEGPGENFFLVKGGTVKTPPLGNVLAGITRETVMELLKGEGYTTVEAQISLEEALEADEAFFTGTAAEVTPIRSIDGKILGSGSIGPVSQMTKQLYFDTVRGKKEDFRKYISFARR